MTYYLRFSSEESFQEESTKVCLYILCEEQAPQDAESADEISAGYYNLTSHEHAMDIIGTISQGGQWDDETGEELEPPTVLDGWHVNYIGELPEGWDQYLVFPENPVRKFAGVD
jgi:hypothetical protein